MAFPYDENFEEDSGVFGDITERPTQAEGRRQRKRQLAQDPDYQRGRMMKAIIQMRHELDEAKEELREIHQTRITVSPPPPPIRPSLKPQVATAGISATVTAAVIAIWQTLRAVGVIK
jgi:hypothetical protein